MPESPRLVQALRSILSSEQLARLKHRLAADESPLCGDHAEHLRLHGRLSLELLAAGGGDPSDTSRDDEALLLRERLVSFFGPSDTGPHLSAYANLIASSTPELIAKAIMHHT